MGSMDGMDEVLASITDDASLAVTMVADDVLRTRFVSAYLGCLSLAAACEKVGIEVDRGREFLRSSQFLTEVGSRLPDVRKAAEVDRDWIMARVRSIAEKAIADEDPQTALKALAQAKDLLPGVPAVKNPNLTQVNVTFGSKQGVVEGGGSIR